MLLPGYQPISPGRRIELKSLLKSDVIQIGQAPRFPAPGEHGILSPFGYYPAWHQTGAGESVRGVNP